MSHLVSVKLLKHSQNLLYILKLDILCSTSGSDYVTMQGKRPEVCAWLCLYHLPENILKNYIDRLFNLNCQSGCFLYSQNRILNLHYLFMIFTRFSRIWILIRSESDSKWWSDLFWFWAVRSLTLCFPAMSHRIFTAWALLSRCSGLAIVCWEGHLLSVLEWSVEVSAGRAGGFHISDKTLRWGKHLKLWMWHPRYSWVGVGEEM